MRQSLAKGTRRQLRRTVGQAALETFGQFEEAVQGLGLSVNKLRGDLSELARDHATAKKDLSVNLHGIAETLTRDERSSVALARHYAEFRARPFLGRLRWLVTGQ